MTTIFIAEDHQIIRMALKTALENSGEMTVIGEASDGEAALAGILGARPDVAIIDIGLPGQNGIDITRQIKKEHPECHVMIFTGHGDDANIFACLAAGADGYLLKDSCISQLMAAVRTVASGAAWLDPQFAHRVLQQSARAFTSDRKPALPKPKRDGKQLSAREREVLSLITEGLGNQEIAGRLFLSIETVKSHVRHVMEKLRVSSRTEAAVKGVQLGLVTLEAEVA